MAWIILVASGVMESVWASALGASDNFRKPKPTVLFAVDGYRYNGKGFDIRPTVESLRGQLPGLAATLIVAPPAEPSSATSPSSHSV